MIRGVLLLAWGIALFIARTDDTANNPNALTNLEKNPSYRDRRYFRQLTSFKYFNITMVAFAIDYLLF
jgi:hypothetical protein